MLNSLPRQCRVRVSCIIFHGHSFLCPARTYRLWPPLHETKIPLHRTTVVKMISPASRDVGRPVILIPLFFAPRNAAIYRMNSAENWKVTRRSSQGFNCYCDYWDGQHFYSFLRANVPFDYPDRVARQNQRDSSISRFLSFFFFYK